MLRQEEWQAEPGLNPSLSSVLCRRENRLERGRGNGNFPDVESHIRKPFSSHATSLFSLLSPVKIKSERLVNARFVKRQPVYCAELVETEDGGNNVMLELDGTAVTAGWADEGSAGVAVVWPG